MTVSVFARTPTLLRSGEVESSSLTAFLRYSDVSTWLLTVDAASASAELMQSAAGVVITRDGSTLLSGPIEYRGSALSGDKHVLTFAGTDDTVWLRRRLALPVPSGPPYTAAAYDVRSGPAETVIRGYVDANAGPGAIVARRVAGLTLPASLGLGAAVGASARFDNLLELVRSISLVGGVGFRVVQVGAGLQLQLYVPVNRTGTAKFSTALGNLAEYSYSATDPRVTYAYVGGQGEGTARTIIEGSAVSPPYRAEVFKDQRNTNDALELAQARDEALQEGAAETSLSITPIDTPSLTLGRDYGLGDSVAVLVDGVQINDVVREVKLELTAARGEELKPVVGTPGARSPDVPRLFDALRQQDYRLARLERR